MRPVVVIPAPGPAPPLATVSVPHPFVIDGGLLKFIGPTPAEGTDMGANWAAASRATKPRMTPMRTNVDANEDKGPFAVYLEAAFM